MDKEQFLAQFNKQGYVVLDQILAPAYIIEAKNQLIEAIAIENEYHHSHAHKDSGMVLLCSLYHSVFTDLFDNHLMMTPFNTILGDGCIVYAYTSSSMPPHGSNYSNRIHVDCPRLIPNYITNIGATILLDDFTEENGATWFLPQSHSQEAPPEEDFFYKNAKRVIAKAGSVFFFNARLWHAGGVNKTENWRHALTINMARPWMKQRIDIPRAMSNMNLAHLSPEALQKLGFMAQVPSNYDEYYAPPEHRKFKQKTE